MKNEMRQRPELRQTAYDVVTLRSRSWEQKSHDVINSNVFNKSDQRSIDVIWRCRSVVVALKVKF